MNFHFLEFNRNSGSNAKLGFEDGFMQREVCKKKRKAYGCIQVKTGDEEKTAKKIRTIYPEIEVYAISQIKHKSCKGVRSYSSSIMMPGYLVFCTDCDMRVSQFLSVSSAYHILTYGDSQWHLRGDDLFYAKWIFSNRGTIGVSVVFAEGDVIKIIKGPLKEIEGKILRIDKRNRNALISLGFGKQILKTWLAFEWMDKK